MLFINDLTWAYPWQGFINSNKRSPSSCCTACIPLPHCSLQNGVTAYSPPDQTHGEQNILSCIVLCFYISQELINMYFFVVSLLAGAQCLEIGELRWCFDSVTGLVLEDCQMSLLPNIVLSIYSQISPEPTSSQIQGGTGASPRWHLETNARD